MHSPLDTTISIPLSPDEAVVLFEFVRRFSDSNTLAIEDQAEQRALWNLCCVFEKHLNLPIEGSYAEILWMAQDRLRDE
jgi:hypothetical protein